MTEEQEQHQKQNDESTIMDQLFHSILDGHDDHFPITSNNEQNFQNLGKRKINHRHTTEQIQRLEA